MDLAQVNVCLVALGPFVVIGGLGLLIRWAVYKDADRGTVAMWGAMQVRAAEAQLALKRIRLDLDDEEEAMLR